jgi:radical SAM superfamily enzyme YgiQ (UPF0313 family)
MTTLSIKKVNKGIKDFNLKNKNKKNPVIIGKPFVIYNPNDYLKNWI